MACFCHLLFSAMLFLNFSACQSIIKIDQAQEKMPNPYVIVLIKNSKEEYQLGLKNDNTQKQRRRNRVPEFKSRGFRLIIINKGSFRNPIVAI
ncbi:hypothetical protein ACFVAD_03500 [Sutcliffiella sp. NPDC057660]|uniref:hypothetical protein n=1 Tax=Sutcliffiella sp. NPDC057660 TaxID=3346199 RepID=UPI00369A0F53